MEKGEFIFTQASNLDLKKSRDLVIEEYKKEGYKNEINASAAKTFVAKKEEAVVGTISMVFEKNLPMEELYSGEISELRNNEKKLAEVCQLAVAREQFSFKDRNAILKGLFNLVLSEAASQNIDMLTIAINPKHEIFYKALGFEDLGGHKIYPSVNAPAIAKVLDLHKEKPLLGAFLKV